MKFKITRKDQDVIASVMLYEEKWWLWVISIKNLIAYGASLFALSLLGVAYLSFHEPASQKDYLTIRSTYEQFSKGDISKLSELEKGLKDHNELQGKYGHSIANQLLSIGQTQDATGYATQTLKRTKGLTPFYAEFAKATLAIAENKLETALNMAYELRSKMDGSTYKVLTIYNLLRIASIERELAHLEKERDALDQLQAFLQTHKGDQEIDLLIDHFQVGAIGLTDYIASRY